MPLRRTETYRFRLSGKFRAGPGIQNGQAETHGSKRLVTITYSQNHGQDDNTRAAAPREIEQHLGDLVCRARRTPRRTACACHRRQPRGRRPGANDFTNSSLTSPSAIAMRAGLRSRVIPVPLVCGNIAMPGLAVCGSISRNRQHSTFTVLRTPQQQDMPSRSVNRSNRPMALGWPAAEGDSAARQGGYCAREIVTGTQRRHRRSRNRNRKRLSSGSTW